MQFFNDRPKYNIILGHNLFKSWEKVTKQNKGTKISDLYLVQTHKMFEFVHKHSWRGRWLALKIAIKRIFRHNNDALTFASNLKKVADVFEAANNFKFFDQAAKKLNENEVTAEKLQQEFQKLRGELESLKNHVQQKRVAKKRNIESIAQITFPSFVKKTHQVVAPFFNDLKVFRAETDQLLNQIFKNRLTDEQKSEIITLIQSDININEIIEGMKIAQAEEEPLRSPSIEPLRTALLKGLAYVSEQKTSALYDALDYLNPPLPKENRQFNLKLKQFAHAFGDSFIRKSGLEDDVSSRPYVELMAQFIKTRGYESPLALQMESFLTNFIDLRETNLTSQDLREEIKNKLKSFPGEQKKCLLVGGWVRHGIVYEIEKQTDGRYAFRIFNKGEGIELADQLKESYQTKYAGCIAVKNIPEKLLFKKNFLASLQAVSSINQDGVKGVKPQGFLIDHLLPMLGGEKEIADPRIDHFLLPQKSGTCGYASLQACTAHMMDSEEFQRFECEFKTFLLEKYRVEIDDALATPINKDNYSEFRCHYLALKRSVQFFADSLKQTQAVIPEKSLKVAEKQILEYQAYTARMEKKLLAFEKNAFTESLKSLSEKTLPLEVAGSFNSNPLQADNNQLELKPQRLTKNEQILVKLIDDIPEFSDHPDYSSRIEACIAEISQYKYIDLELIFLADLLFKKIGPLANLKSVTYKYPQNAIENLFGLQSNLSRKIGTAQKYEQTRERLMFLSTSIAIEEALKQLPAKERLICFDQTGSIISSSLLPKLNSFRCSDPYWVSVIREMKEIASSSKKKPELFLNMSNLFQKEKISYKNGKYKPHTTALSDSLINQIYSWWNSDDNNELRKQVFESCKNDRPVQEEDKKARIKAEEIKKANCEAELKNLLNEKEKLNPEIKSLNSEIRKLEEETSKLVVKAWELIGFQNTEENKKILADKESFLQLKNTDLQTKREAFQTKKTKLDTINNQIVEKNREIDACKNMIQAIPSIVERDAQYWPKDFETGKLDRATIATFFFANQHDFFRKKLRCHDPLPEHFRIYCHSCLLSQNIDHKKSLGAIVLGLKDFRYKIKEYNRISDLKELSINSTDTFTAPSKYFEDDPYYPQYIDNNFKVLYTNVFRKREEETHLPAAATRQDTSTFNREVIKELHSIRTSSEVQIESAIYYFKENPDLLGQRNWINFFHSLLFESDLLLSELEDDNKRALLLPKLQNFFKVAIRNAIELDDMATAANLAWIASDAQKYLNLVAENRRKQGKPPLQDGPILTTTQLLEISKLGATQKYANQWPIVSEALLAASESLFDKSPVSNEEKELFIFACIAHLMHKKLAISEENKCYSRGTEANEAIKKLKSWFSASPLPLSVEELNLLLNRYGIPILNTIYPSLNIRTFVSSQDPTETDCFVADEGTKISLTDGRIRVSDLQKLRVYDSPVDQRVTNLMIEQGVYSPDDDLSNLRCFVEGLSIHIRDFNKGLDFVVYLNEISPEESKVYVNLGEELGRALYKPIKERKYITNHELKRNYHHLLVNHQLYFCDPVTFKPLLQCNGQAAGLRKIETIPEKAGEKPLIVSRKMQKAFFDSFEDPSCTIYWSRGKQLEKISFPRLNINLEREIQAGEGRWIYGEDPRWFLAAEQFVPHFGQSTGFLVLENHQGQKKVLFPVWNSAEKKDSSLNFPYHYVFDAENSRKGRVVECDLVGTKVVPKTDEARFYLAKIYLEKGMVDIVEELLFTVEAELNHKAYSEEALAMLQLLYSSPLSKSIDPNLLRIRMHALYLYEKNCDQFPKKSETVHKMTNDVRGEIQKVKTELINQYLERNHELLLLPEHEELLVIKKIMPNSPRIKELESKRDPVLGQITISMNERTKLNLRSSCCREDDYSYPKYKPSLKDRFKYRWARLSNTFPFNPQSVGNKEFTKYYKQLEKECMQAFDWNKAKKNGLAQAVYYLACFSMDPDIQKKAQDLLRLLTGSLRGNQTGIRSSHLLPKHPITLPTGRTLYQGLQDLVMVTSMIGPDDPTIEERSEFCPGVVNKFFEKKETISSNISSQKIFSTNYPEVSNQTVKSEFEKMMQDLDATHLAHTDYDLKQPLGDLNDELKLKLQTESKYLTDQEQLITNALASALTADSVSRLEFTSKKRSLPSIDEVCMLFARNDYHSFAKQLYPELSKEGRENLQKAVKHYLIQKQYVQQIGRSLRKVEELSVAQNEEKINADMLQMLMNQIGSSLDENRCYDLENDVYAPIFLLMETVLNITLRQDQVENIKKFADAVGSDQSIALQMIMGAGKTFVLQPTIAYLLTFMFADSSRLSTVIVPEALYKPVIESLSKCLGTAFNQFIFFMPYDRELAKDEAYLTTYLNRLKEAKDRGACLFMTPRQKHSILTSLYEAYFDGNESTEGRQYETKRHRMNDQTRIILTRINLIADICNFLELHEIDQVDEIDTIMKPDVIFKYPIGSKEKINQERGSALVSLMTQFVTDQELSEKVSIDFVDAFQKRVNPEYVKKGSTLTEELFEQFIQPKLVDIACSVLENIKGKSFKEIIKKDPYSYVRHFISQTTPYDEEIRACLTEDEEQKIIDQVKKKLGELSKIDKNRMSPNEILVTEKLMFKNKRDMWIKENFLNVDERELLGTMALAVSKILPKALFKECGSKYGIDPNQNKFIARPYEAPDAPKPTNYQGPYEQCIYSTMLNLFYGPNENGAKQMLDQLRASAQVEMRRGKCPIFETTSYKELTRLLGPKANKFRLFDKEPSEGLIKAFHEAVKKDAKSIQIFMLDHVLEQISMYKKSLFSTAHTMMGSSRLSCGYTGTMQQGILPRNMKSVPEIGTDGKTMSAVQSKMEAGLSNVQVYREENQRSLTDQIIESYIADPDQFVLIDSGAWLKEVNIDRYTEKLLVACENSENRHSINGIVYHNAKGEIISLERDPVTREFIRLPISQSKYKTTNGELLTVIQKKYDTGTNIPQMPTAKAIMSIPKNCNKRDALQAIFRMREILFGQKVSFAVSGDVNSDVATTVVHGLLQKEAIKQLFNREAIVNPQEIIHQLNLPQESETFKNDLMKTLTDFLESEEYGKYCAGEINRKAAILSFSKLFHTNFEIHCDSLWRYFAVNQTLDTQNTIWMAAKQRMREVVEKLVRRTLSNTALSVQERGQLFQAMIHFLVETNEDSPFETILNTSHTISAEKAIGKEVKRYLQLINSFDSLSPNLRQAIDKNIKEFYGETNLKEVLESCANIDEMAGVLKRSSDQPQEIEVEVEVELEQEEEVELEHEQEVRVENAVNLISELPYRKLRSKKGEGYDINEFLGGIKGPEHALGDLLPQKVRAAFVDADSIACSPNLMLQKAQLGTSLAGNYHLPGRYLLALSNPKMWGNSHHYIIVSKQDAALIKNGLSNSQIPKGCHAGLFALDGDLVAGDKECEKVFNDKQHQRVLLQTKFILGKINFSEQETNQFKSFIPEDANTLLALSKFNRKILRHLPETAKHYPGSYMDRMLNRLHQDI